MEATRTMDVAGRVRRRMLAGAVVSRAGWGLVAGGIFGLVLVLMTRMGWLGSGLGSVAGPSGSTGGAPWWGLLAASVGAGLVGGAAIGLLRRRSLLEAAQLADAVSGLRDRLSNALSFSQRHETNASEQLAIADAERSTERVDPRRVVPIRFGSAWVVGPVVVASAVATGLFVPVRQDRLVTPAAQRGVTDAERSAAAEVIASAAAEAREVASGPVGARATNEELERMEQIERELLDGERSPTDALAEGSQQLESIADRVEREAAAEALADQATREAMADSIDAGEDDSALAKALADGDLEAAREAAKELFDRIDQLSPEDRGRLAAELDRLAEQTALAPADTAETGSPTAETGPPQADQSRAPPPAADPRFEELLREQGAEGMPDIADSQDAEAIRERLEKEGIEPEAARRLAEELARENRDRAAAERAREERQELSEAAKEAAEELREPPPPGPKAGNPQDDEPAGTNTPEPRQPDRGDDPLRDGAESEEKPGGEQSEQGTRGQDDQQPGGERDEGQPRQGDNGQTREGKQGQSQSQSEGDSTSKSQGQQQSQGEQESQGEQGDRQGGGQTQGEGERQDAGEQPGQPGNQKGDQEGPGEQPGQRPGGLEGDAAASEGEAPERSGGEGDNAESQSGKGESGEQGPERLTDGQGEAADPRGVERLRKQLDRMAERAESAREKQRSAEKLREQAERMLDGATPEQREELEQFAREMARQNRGDGGGEPGGGAGTGPKNAAGAQPTPDRAWETEDVDARGEVSGTPDSEGRVVAEWFGKEGDRPAGAGSIEPGTGAGSAVDQAAQGAERAVERRAVPRERRELVRRVFERYRQRAAERESGDRSDGSGGGS